MRSVQAGRLGVWWAALFVDVLGLYDLQGAVVFPLNHCRFAWPDVFGLNALEK